MKLRRTALVGSLIALLASSAAAEMLDIEGTYGNEAGCRYVRGGAPDGEEGMLVLKAGGVDGYATACEFLQILTARDGSKLVTSMCGYEGEEGMGGRLLVITQNQSDPVALRIHTEHGELWDEVRPCS